MVGTKETQQKCNRIQIQRIVKNIIMHELLSRKESSPEIRCVMGQIAESLSSRIIYSKLIRISKTRKV